MSKETKEFDWFDQPKNIKFLDRLLKGACLLAVLAEIPLAISHSRHGHFEDYKLLGIYHDGSFASYAVLGFAACSASILVAKGLSKFLKKPEDYYESQKGIFAP